MNSRHAFTTVRNQNIIVKVGHFSVAGRYVLFNALNHTWDRLASLKDAPMGDVWHVLAVYANCSVAQKIVISVIKQLTAELERGNSPCLVPMPRCGSNRFRRISRCADCDKLRQCQEGLSELSRVPDAWLEG